MATVTCDCAFPPRMVNGTAGPLGAVRGMRIFTCMTPLIRRGAPPAFFRSLLTVQAEANDVVGRVFLELDVGLILICAGVGEPAGAQRGGREHAGNPDIHLAIGNR